MTEKKMALTFEPAFSKVNEVRKKIEAFCRRFFGRRTSVSLIKDFGLAAAETLNNTVEHSEAESISIEVTASGEGISLTVLTKAKRFDPRGKVIMPSFEEGELPEGGFGIAIVRELVDEISYEYVDGINVLTIRKHFG